MKKERTTNPLAIVGIACRFPKADDPKSYWKNLKGGVDAITEIPATHWNPSDYFDNDPKTPDKTYARRGGFLNSMQFNPMEYGMAPNAIEATDTAQLLGMVVAKEALADAGYGGDKKFDRMRTSVILGVTGTLELVIPLGARLGHPIWRKAMKEAGVDDAAIDDAVTRISDSYVGWQENSFPGLLGNVVAGRIANQLNLGGTNCVVDAACASSLSAIHLAGMELQSGRSDMVITGGVDTFNDIFMYMCFSKTPALSPTGNAKPFDHKGDGTILGEGVGMIVLKRLEDAEKDGDNIYAVLKGVGSSSDGKGTAIYEPSPGGQSRALKTAYEVSGVSPETVELVEAHGTGTKVGDATEAKALSEIYRAYRENGTWCALGSVKSMIGHTKAAAGAAGLIKTVMALKEKTLPPTIKVEKPGPAVAPKETPFYINTDKRPWAKRGEHPRRAAVSALGFGGSNFHCVVEEYGSRKSAADWDGDVQIIAFSASDDARLDEALGSFPSDESWESVRAAAAKSRKEFNPGGAARIVVVAERGGGLADQLAQARTLLKKSSGQKYWSAPSGVYYGAGPSAGKIAALFPGQGSQYTGMLRDVMCQFPGALEALEEANDNFSGKEESRLSDLIYPIPSFSEEDARADEENLRATYAAQPAIGAVSVGCLNVLKDFGFKPDAAAGHSYGELTALYAAGRFDAPTLIKLSELRGRLMAQGKGDLGGMLAVQAPMPAVESALKDGGFDLVLANKNAPSQCVLSGASAEIEKAESYLNEKGIRCKRLPVAAAFHSKLVSDARKPFEKELKDVAFAKGAFPVFSNTTGEAYPDAPAKARVLLAGQLANPVEFVKEIENLYAQGVRTFVEVGPGARLSGLVKAILEGKDAEAVAVDASCAKRSGIADFARALAALSARGQALALEKWDENFCPPAHAETEKPAFTVSIGGANYMKERKKRSAASRPAPQPQVAPQIPISPPAIVSAPIAQGRVQEHLEALQRIQEQTAALHAKFLEGQEEALKTIQALIAQEQGTVLAAPVPAAARVEAPSAAAVASVSAAAPVVVETPAASAVSLDTSKVEAVLLDVVSEKTGYPAEMLNLDMGLDSDLGIDSIKRVEILSSLQEKLPGAPVVKPDQLGTLRTLRQIVSFLSVSDVAGTVSDAAPVPSSGSVDTAKIEAVLLEVVSEKTGYPAEMLNLDMGLDSDLGIDSIKRVEILSSLQEKLPGAPVVKPDQLGTLRTLRQIVSFLSVSDAAGTVSDAVQQKTPAAAAAQAPEQKPSNALLRQVVEFVQADAGRPAVSLAEGCDIAITDSEDGFCAKIAAALAARGFKTKIIAYENWTDYSRPKNFGGLIVAAPVSVSSAYVKSALFLAQRAFSGLNAKRSAVFACVTRIDGAFGFESMPQDMDPAVGALAGLVKTADLEWPNVSGKAIDVHAQMNAESAANRVVEELLILGPNEAGISEEGVRTVRLSQTPLPNGKSIPLSPDDVIVVTGGARGVTAECAISLARAFKPTLVLLGRSAAPTPEPEWLSAIKDDAAIKKELLKRAGRSLSPKELEERFRDVASNREMLANIARMERSGSTVLYRSVDVTDGSSVKDAMSEIINTEGPVRGFVHGAGVLADRRIEDKTEEQFDKVYGTKVGGLGAVWSAIDEAELKVCVLFSSTTGRYGRVGQVDYAMANEALSTFARQKAAALPGCRVVAVGWGPWEGGMVTPGLRKVFEKEGVGLIPLKAGAEYLIGELKAGDGPAEVVLLGVPRDGASPEQNGAADSSDENFHEVFSGSVDTESHPVLKSHVIDGKAVVPMALIVEWLAHGALHENPGLVFGGFEDLRILKGVRFGEGESPVVSVSASVARKEGNLWRVKVELRSGDGKDLHARGDVMLSERVLEPSPAVLSVSPKKFPGPVERIYKDYLFHGEDLRGIRDIAGCAPEGIVADVVKSPAPSQWVKKPQRSRWIADPMALDCAFQLMIVWSFEKHGAGSLPVFAAKYRQFKSAFPKEGVRIVIRVTKNGAHRATADMEFLDSSGGVVARLEGYECVVDASLNDAFKRRSVPSIKTA